MQQVKAVERLTIEAALTGSRDAALQAFALHPLVDSVTVARDLLSGYIDAGSPRWRRCSRADSAAGVFRFGSPQPSGLVHAKGARLLCKRLSTRGGGKGC